MKHWSLGRLSALLVAFLVTLGAWAPSFANPTAHSLTGNARFNIGSLPLPVTATPPPLGNRLVNTLNATVRVHGAHAALAPAKITLRPAQLTFNGVGVAPIGTANPVVQQVGTQLTFKIPAGNAVFAKGLRTGAPTVAWCPGSTVPDTPAGNPNCPTATGGTIPGRLTYTATGNQFGGPARGLVGGTADVALNLGGLNPNCFFVTDPTCSARFVGANPVALGVAGGAFNVSVPVISPSINPGLFGVDLGPNSTIVQIVTTLGPGLLTNDGTSFGAPWTTGQILIEQPAANGGPETFLISGSDARIAGPTSNGQGNLSLVTGYLSDRMTSGANGNRGWLNLTIGAPIGGPHIPAMPLLGAIAVLGITGFTGVYALRRKS